MDSNSVNSIGLIFDIIGVLLLFKYGLPSDVSKNGTSFLVDPQTDEVENSKFKRYKLWSYLALSLLVFGFVIQIVSNCDSIFHKECQQQIRPSHIQQQ